MSGQLIHFTPNVELEPTANLDAFINFYSQSEVLGAQLQFDKNVWDVGYQKGHKKVLRVIFRTVEAAVQGQLEPMLPQPFLSFAKASLVYLQEIRPVVTQSTRISALRYLEAALRDLNMGGRPTAITPVVLDRAVELARASVSAGVAYRVAGQLEAIAKFMACKSFIKLRQVWTHGMKKPREHGSRISKEALKARQEKLPSAAALRALGGIFHEAVEPADVLVSSYMALMVCAPERINEVLRLQRNCIVAGEGRFAGKSGLRWPGSKGFGNTTKWLPMLMAPVALEAVKRLLSVTYEGHTLAEWYSENPSKMFYHADATHLRSLDVLSPGELALVLWGAASSRVAATTWAKGKGIAAVPLGKRRIGYLRNDVERAVVAMLPATFPHVPGDDRLPFREALAVVRTNELHAERATYLCMFDCVDYGTVANKLGVPGKQSIFDRFGFTEDDGTRIGLNTHSLRHYLNMLAQLGALSSSEIAIFSGRKDVSQNLAYDHMSSAEVQAPISAAIRSGFTANLVPAASREISFRSEFKGLGLVAAHTTEYGWCMHNFSSEPCQMYRDCINCEELECVKGETHKEANLRHLKQEIEYLLEKARTAQSEEEYGADKWVKHQTVTLERVNALLVVMDDQAVAIGARIRLDCVVNAPLIASVSPALPINTRRERKGLR